MSDLWDDIVETVSEGAEKLEGSLTHSLRSIEDSIDTDDDGSLLDELGTVIKEIPVVGDHLGSVGEELGDMVTDVLGTRNAGVFSEHGTRDEDTSDPDYKPDSEFEQQGGGFGSWVNDKLGIGENSPADIPGAGVIVMAGDYLLDNDDPMVAGDQSSDYYDYDNGGAGE
jgi:hypothetical protein